MMYTFLFTFENNYFKANGLILSPPQSYTVTPYEAARVLQMPEVYQIYLKGIGILSPKTICVSIKNYIVSENVGF